MSLKKSWSEEKTSAYLYQIISQSEKTDARKTLFSDLADMANKQADIWEKEIKKSGGKVPTIFHPNLRTRIVGKLIGHVGAKPLRYILSAMKVRGMSIYSNTDPNYPFSTVAAHHEHRHKGLTAAGNIRAAVFGANDGLISNVSLLLGIVHGRLAGHWATQACTEHMPAAPRHTRTRIPAGGICGRPVPLRPTV